MIALAMLVAAGAPDAQALAASARSDAAVLRVALVADEGATLRSAPRESASAQATLSRGDWLEVRGEAPGYWQVYDRRRERPGYVRPAQVRVHPVEASEAPKLVALAMFLRDLPGFESLGIGAAALALRCDPRADSASLQLAIGVMAERLARQPRPAQRDTAQVYGVAFVAAESAGAVRTCYDGAALRSVLASSDATPDERAQAALLLTARCLEPAEREERDFQTWRLSVLTPLEPAQSRLGTLVHLARADALARLAFYEARAHEPAKSAPEAAREWMLADASLLADEDAPVLAEVRARVASSRFAGIPLTSGSLVRPGGPGESCIAVESAMRCTYGVVHEASAQRTRDTLAVSVQPLDSWTELWVFHKTKRGWRVSVLPPATALGGVGAVQPLGISRDGQRVLVLRETAKTRRFEERRASDLLVLRSSSAPIGDYASPAALASLP